MAMIEFYLCENRYTRENKLFWHPQNLMDFIIKENRRDNHYVATDEDNDEFTHDDSVIWNLSKYRVAGVTGKKVSPFNILMNENGEMVVTSWEWVAERLYERNGKEIRKPSMWRLKARCRFRDESDNEIESEEEFILDRGKFICGF